jgi:hypothetical protein
MDKSTDKMIVTAHTHSSNHREQIEASKSCGCFHCIKIFPPSAIREWTDDGQTAICPFCGVDSIIGSASDVPFSEEFLVRMKEHWFDK